MASDNDIIALATAGWRALMEGQQPGPGFVAATGCLPAGAHGMEMAMRRAMAGSTPTGRSALHASVKRTARVLFGRDQHFEGIPIEGAAVWLCLLGPDGYVREAALRALDVPPPTSFLAATLLRRLNDWAGPVREVAASRLPNLVDATAPEVLGPAMAALLPQALTFDRGWLRGASALEAMLRRPGVAAAVTTYLRDAPAGPKPTALPILLRLGLGEAALRDLAHRAVSPGLRAMAVEALVSGRARWQEGWFRYWIDKPMGVAGRRPALAYRDLAGPPATEAEALTFARDPSARVRRAVLDGALETRPPWLGRLADILADDPWPSVRDRAVVAARHASQAASRSE
ncbi:MAG: hypothetical protein AAF366_18075 [Pseudomonadota bacterium]